MRIGELAARSGVSVRALRYYEEQELLAAARTASGQRHYPEAAADRVHLIQQLYAAGLTSSAIRGLLPCVTAGVSTPGSMALLRAERARLDARIADLTAARTRLDAVIRAAAGADSPCAYTDPAAAASAPADGPVATADGPAAAGTTADGPAAAGTVTDGPAAAGTVTDGPAAAGTAAAGGAVRVGVG